jgi:putative ABC transport system substrate-binding protein
MKRRDLMMLAGGAIMAWPSVGRAQQGRVRRVGMLLPATATDPEYVMLVNAFIQKLQLLGWTEGSNVRFEARWAGGETEANRRFADELVALAPDVILASGNSAAGPMLQATRAIPIVFAIVPDPLGAGLVDSLARPGGNATGFSSFSYDIGGKWLELLKEIAPGVARVGVLRDPNLTAGVGQWSAVQTAAPSFGLETSPINLRDVPELEQAMATFARKPNGGLIITSSGLAVKHRATIVVQAAKLKLPAIYYSRPFVSAGGLISFGSDRAEQFRSAAVYVDRILKGEKPSDLPVQTPTKYELAVNLKTATALGLSIGPALLARATDVIE